VDILLPLIKARQRAAHLFDAGAGLARLPDGQEHRADLLSRDEVPRHIADARVCPHPQPVLVRAGRASAKIPELHLFVEKRGERLPQGRVTPMRLRLRVCQGLTQIDAGHPEAVEVPHEILCVLLGRDHARDPQCILL
jgi:sirohydrochlorin ferrochelatase